MRAAFESNVSNLSELQKYLENEVAKFSNTRRSKTNRDHGHHDEDIPENEGAETVYKENESDDLELKLATSNTYTAQKAAELVELEQIQIEYDDDVSDQPPNPVAFGAANSLAANSWVLSDMMRGISPPPITNMNTNTNTNTVTNPITNTGANTNRNTATYTNMNMNRNSTVTANTRRKFRSICGTMTALPVAAVSAVSVMTPRVSLSKRGGSFSGTRERAGSFSADGEMDLSELADQEPSIQTGSNVSSMMTVKPVSENKVKEDINDEKLGGTDKSNV